jgi:hypothetical protein
MPSTIDLGRDLDDFRRFMLLSIFKLGLYKAFEDSKPVYCVGLLVRCEDPGGWVAVWSRCYDKVEKAAELLKSIEPLARNKLGGLLAVVEISLPGRGERQTVAD